MPHRITYFFSRQFLDYGLEPASTSKQKLDRETHIKEYTRCVESDLKSIPRLPHEITFTKTSALSNIFTGNKKVARCASTHVKTWLSNCDDGRETLLSPTLEAEPVLAKVRNGDHIFERQVSLPGLSRGSSYAGSFFSDAGMEAISRNVKDSRGSNISYLLPTEKQEAVLEEESRENLSQKIKESYYLQLAYYLLRGRYRVSTRSYLASGCLTYADKISDGFYNILGMNPYLWLMCSDVEEGRRLPPLMLLKRRHILLESHCNRQGMGL